MTDTTVLVALLGIFSLVITSAFGMATWSQKKVATTQDALVAALKEQIASGEKRETALNIDNREQAVTIGKLGVSVDKLAEQGVRTLHLLEEAIYGRQGAEDRRRGH